MSNQIKLSFTVIMVAVFLIVGIKLIYIQSIYAQHLNSTYNVQTAATNSILTGESRYYQTMILNDYQYLNVAKQLIIDMPSVNDKTFTLMQSNGKYIIEIDELDTTNYYQLEKG